MPDTDTATKAAKLIEQRKFSEAIELLNRTDDSIPASERFSMLGLCYFHKEEYAAAG